jgi:hypothetical protein
MNDRTKSDQCDIGRVRVHAPFAKCATNGRTILLTTGSFKSSGRTSIRDKPKATLYTIKENEVKRAIVKSSFRRLLGAYGYRWSVKHGPGRKEITHKFRRIQSFRPPEHKTV